MRAVVWDDWVKAPGLPPYQEVLLKQFETPVIQNAKDFALLIIDNDGQLQPQVCSQTTQGWGENVKFIFLQTVYEQSNRLSEKILEYMDACFSLSGNGNPEVKWRWYRIIPFVKSYQDKKIDIITTFLGGIGRGKMIDPIYQSLMDTNQQSLAAQIFDKYRVIY